MQRDRSAARRILLRNLMNRHRISSQADLVRRLGESGHPVTQATVSRDLTALGAEKIDGPSGTHYRLGRVSAEASGWKPRLRRSLAEHLEAVIPCGNLVVLKVAPATANTVAAAIDECESPEIAGTVAGDDTILVVALRDDGGVSVANFFMELMEE